MPVMFFRTSIIPAPPPPSMFDADVSANTGRDIFNFAGALSEEAVTGTPTAGSGTLTINEQFVHSYDYMVVDGPITLDQSTADSWFTAGGSSRSAWIVVKGDLTIPVGILLKPPSSTKTFTVLFVTGDLEVTGEISMSSSGANHSNASGSNIANVDVPIHGTWMISGSPQNEVAGRTSQGQNDGLPGLLGSTAGGGSGAAHVNGVSGGGASGSIFSGGPGGGSDASSGAPDGEDGGIDGGKGGDGVGGSNWAGGAGNPGGDGAGNGNDGDEGTGGVLVVFCQGDLSGSGDITADGADGGDATSTVGGGASGGGSISVFSGTDSSTITIRASGGVGGVGGDNRGGHGGDGTERSSDIDTPIGNNQFIMASPDTDFLSNPNDRWLKPVLSCVWWNSSKSRWDGILPFTSTSDYYICKNANSASPGKMLVVDTRASVRPDIWWDDTAGKVYITASHNSAPRAYIVNYNSSTDIYTMDATVNGITITDMVTNLDSDATPLVTLISPNGHWWTAMIEGTELRVNRSTDGGATWGSAEVIIATGTTTGIASLTNFADGGTNYIHLFGCETDPSGDQHAYIIDEDETNFATADWTIETSSIPAFATNEHSDNHLCARVHNDIIYIVVKLAYDGSSLEPIVLYERASGGAYTKHYVVFQADAGFLPTRPAISIDISNNEIYIIYGQINSPQEVFYKVAGLSALATLSAVSQITIFSELDTFTSAIAPRENVTTANNVLLLANTENPNSSDIGPIHGRVLDIDSDPDWNNVVLLLDYEEATKALIADASNEAATITIEGSVMDISTSLKIFGTQSINNPATNNGFVRVDHDTAQWVGSGDWTIETWFYAAGGDSFRMIMGKWHSATNNRMITMDRTSTNVTLNVSITGSSTIASCTVLPPTGWKSQWYFIAGDYDGTTVRLYLWDPVADQIVTDTDATTRTLFNSTADMSLGSQVDNAFREFGNWDDSRFTVGVARYQGTLIVPTKRFPRN